MKITIEIPEDITEEEIIGMSLKRKLRTLESPSDLENLIVDTKFKTL
jgi:hypothetical protein